MEIDETTRRELARVLSLIVPRLFDDDPGPAVFRLRALAEKHGLHPTQFSIAINGQDHVADLKRDLDEATMAAWRDTAQFTAACRAKGYKTVEQMAALFDVPHSLIREWQEIGRVPAVFFSILANAPTRKQWSAELKAEVRQQVIEEQRKRRAAAKAAAKRAAAERRRASVVATPVHEPELSLPVPA